MICCGGLVCFLNESYVNVVSMKEVLEFYVFVSD